VQRHLQRVRRHYFVCLRILTSLFSYLWVRCHYFVCLWARRHYFVCLWVRRHYFVCLWVIPLHMWARIDEEHNYKEKMFIFQTRKKYSNLIQGLTDLLSHGDILKSVGIRCKDINLLFDANIELAYPYNKTLNPVNFVFLFLSMQYIRLTTVHTTIFL
jgi:hypothetical protein